MHGILSLSISIPPNHELSICFLSSAISTPTYSRYIFSCSTHFPSLTPHITQNTLLNSLFLDCIKWTAIFNLFFMSLLVEGDAPNSPWRVATGVYIGAHCIFIHTWLLLLCRSFNSFLASYPLHEDAHRMLSNTTLFHYVLPSRTLLQDLAIIEYINLIILLAWSTTEKNFLV